MKLPLFLLILAVSGPCARAATVLLTVTGRVSQTDANQIFATAAVVVGDTWTVTLTYAHPSPPVAVDLGGFHYGGLGLGHRLTFSVNLYTWTGNFALRATPGGPFESFDVSSSLTAADQITPGVGNNSSLILRWNGGGDLIGNPDSLPDSFADWNLPGATSFSLQNITVLDAQANSWAVNANSWDTLTIQVIPEPGTSALAGVALLALLGRRRKAGI
jgi:uncharacterized protein (TIGR03382 family)